MRRPSVRALGRLSQTRYTAIHFRVEDQVAEDQQDSLQNYRSLEDRLASWPNLTNGREATASRAREHMVDAR
jgi:hypothetical protein